MTESTPYIPSPKRHRGLKLLLYLTVIVLFALVGLITTVFFYEDEIKAALIRKLNEGLKAEVRINPADIDVTFIRTFPQCAINLNNVLMLEAVNKKNRDTLLYAGTISLRFDLYDLWHKNYVIRGLSIDNGIAKPVSYKDGTTNYKFWKTDETAATDSFQFRVDQVKLRRTRFVYRDHSSYTICRLNIRSMDLKGDFASEKYELESGVDLQIAELRKDKMTLVNDKELFCELHLLVVGDHYSLSKANVRLNDLALQAKGGFKYSDGRLRSLDLDYHAPDLQIASLLSLVPAKYKSTWDGFDSKGKFFIEGAVNYHLDNWTAHASFGAAKATITNAGASTSAEDVNFSGTFNYGTNSFVELQDLSMNLAGGRITGKGRLENFKQPLLSMDAKVNASLADLQAFLQIDTITEIDGKLALDLHLNGDLEMLRKKRVGPGVEFSLKCEVDQLAARFKHDPKSYAVSHCEIIADNSDIAVRDLLLRRGSSDVLLNGRMPGLLAYLMGEKVPLEINGSLASSHFDFSDFMTGGSAVSAQQKDLIPKGLLLNVTTELKEVKFGKFQAANVRGLAEIRDQKLLVTEVELNAMDGKALVNAFADNSRGRLDVTIESQFRDLNVQELFAEMNDFGQNTLVHQQLKGLVTADLKFSGTWSNQLESDPASIKALCDLRIDKGELVGFSPLQKLGKFIDIHELEHVRFSTLTGKVEIADKKITIPRTSIRNSAINLEFWGSHTFDHFVDYHFQLLLSDLLAARHKKPVDVDEFGAVERDPENKRSVFIVMNGPLDNPKIRYDKSGLQQKIKNDIKNEKKLMGQLIREEFGRKEMEQPNEKQPEFRIEQPEEKPAKKTELVLKKKEEEDF